MINTILIIGGSGNFGGFYAKLFAEKGKRVFISSRDEKKARSVAQKLGVEACEWKEKITEADLIIISVPPRATPAMLQEVAPHCRSGSLLIDFASVKQDAVATLQKISFSRKDIELASIHPMHGPRVASLFDRPVAFIPVRAGEKYSLLKSFFSSEQARVVETTAEKHDALQAIVQGLTHFSAIASGLAIKRLGFADRQLLEQATPVHELLLASIARITQQNPAMYADIQALNHHNPAVRGEFLKVVKELSEVGNDAAKLEPKIVEASKIFCDDSVLAASDEGSSALHYALAKQHWKPQKTFKAAFVGECIATLGPQGTFSDNATRVYCAKNAKNVSVRYFDSLPAVLDAVSSGECAEGVVPIENMLEGVVKPALDSLLSTKLKVKAELVLPIHHCIAALPSTPRDKISQIFSHPQALAQCAAYLRKHFPQATLSPSSSTSAAFKEIFVNNKWGVAAIGPRAAALSFNLKVIDENIEDEKNNATRFFVVAKTDAPRTGNDKTSLLVHSSKDRPGLLRDLLSEFAERKLNLSAIESRPSRVKLGLYDFYLVVNAHRQDAALNEAIASIEKTIGTVDNYGSYPAA